MNNASIFSQIEHRVLVLDGAMGTMIQRYKLTENDYRGKRFSDIKTNLKGCNDLLSLTKPEIISDIHEQYLDVGADIISTNTFNATSVSLEDYGLQHLAYELNVEAAKLARRCADKFTKKNPQKPRFVAGSMGPTNRSLSLSPKIDDPGFRAITFDEMAAAYAEQAEGLIVGGVDVLLVETVFDTLNAKAALFAIQNVFSKLQKTLPIMISVTLEKSGRNLSGQTISAFVESLSHVPLLSIGLNCSFGAKQIRPYLEELSKVSPFYTSVYPNAGMPNQLGEYDETPETMATHVEEILKNRLVNIIGGCCGTSPEHIAKYAEIIAKYEPRKIGYEVRSTGYNVRHCEGGTTEAIHSDDWIASPAARNDALQPTVLTGLETLIISLETNFVNIGEQTNVAGSRKFARLINEKKYEEALSIARTQINNGAQILDVCMDDAMLDAKHEMQTFLNLLASETDIARVPIMIDSSKFEVLEAGLKCVQGKSIVNSISLKEGEQIFLQRAKTIRKLGAATVVMLFDEHGQAVTFEHKIQIAERAYSLLKNADFPTEDIVFDLNILSIGTGISDHDNYAVNFIEACRWIKKNLPNAKVSGGVSNLSFAFRGNEALRSAIHSVFLYHAIQAGLDMAIVNAGKIQPYESIPKDLRDAVEDLVLNRRPDATDRLLALASSFLRKQESPNEAGKSISNGIDFAELALRASVPAYAGMTAIERLQYALKNGISDFIEEDMMQVLPNFSNPVEIIEGPLMTAMSEVGKQFGEGKLFLPQIVKSARVMKKAVAVLEPYINRNEVRGTGYGVRGTGCGVSQQQTADTNPLCSAEAPASVALSFAGSTCKTGRACQDSPTAVEPPPNNVHTNTSGKILLATVKGDVHDIGKNIAGVVLACNGYEIVDLGVMVSCEDIVNAAIEQNVNLIGLSGLITPSLDEMATVAKALQKKNLNIPLVVGGASTSELHTAVYLNPLYNGGVYHAKDASHGAQIVRELTSENTRTKFVEAVQGRYEGLRAEYENRYKVQDTGRHSREGGNPLAMGLRVKPAMTTQDISCLVPRNLEPITDVEKLQNFPLEKLVPYIDWRYFFHAWELPKTNENERKKLQDDAEKMLQKIVNEKLLTANAAYGIFESSPRTSYHERSENVCVFACTAGIGVDALVKKFEKESDSYSALLVQTLADRLAEAFAEYLHRLVSEERHCEGGTTEAIHNDTGLLRFARNDAKPMSRRIAVGYPSYPDHSKKKELFDLIDAEKITGIRLTETFMMTPVASVCGLIFQL